MKLRRLSIFVALSVLAAGAATMAVTVSTSQWVHPGPDGKLVYAPDKQGNCIPDFSNVGYMGGGVTLPAVPAKIVVNPAAGGDDGARIQTAINKISELPVGSGGFRGAVLLKKGLYRIAGKIDIMRDGVVLRGEGNGQDGTVLLATGTKQRTLIAVGGDGKPNEEKGSRQEILGDRIPLGAKSFAVASTNGFHVGDEVIVRRPSPQPWIDDIGMDKLLNPWKPGSKDLLFMRVITALNGNRVTINAPLCNDLRREYGGGAIYKYRFPGRISQVGIESLRGDSEYRNSTDEEHGWTLIGFNGVENGWVKDVTALHFGYSCVAIGRWANSITVEDCACLDPVSQITGGRRYSFAITGQMNLVQRCIARNGRHDFVMHSVVPGPNVFYDCAAEMAHADSGPHHRWSTGTLYDNVRIHGNQLNVRNRGNLGTGHGWAGAYMVLWNCLADSFICEKPPTAQNYAIGCSGKASGNGAWESMGIPVQPQSLYLQQLRDRLGLQAVKNISKNAPRPPADIRVTSTN